MGFQKVFIIGRLGNDPDYRAVAGGKALARFSVATSEKWTDSCGEQKERTEWHRVVAWGKLAEICVKNLGKGSQVFVEGQLQTRSYEDQSGLKKYTTEVVAKIVRFLDVKKPEGDADFFDQDIPF